MEHDVEQGQADIIDVGELEYGGEAALRRALELRDALEHAIITEQPAGPIIDEVFDLIRLGMR